MKFVSLSVEKTQLTLFHNGKKGGYDEQKNDTENGIFI